MNQITNVPAVQWEEWVEENDAVVLDVREPFEWEMGTLPGALLISQGEIVDRVDELPENTKVLCVCHTGGRSGNVAAFLTFKGYDAANLIGGMKALGLQD